VGKDLRTKFNGFILRTKNKFGNVLECLQTEAGTGKIYSEAGVRKALNCTVMCSVTGETVKRNKTASGLI